MVHGGLGEGAGLSTPRGGWTLSTFLHVGKKVAVPVQSQVHGVFPGAQVQWQVIEK